jgi:hypothetical protein
MSYSSFLRRILRLPVTSILPPLLIFPSITRFRGQFSLFAWGNILFGFIQEMIWQSTCNFLTNNVQYCVKLNRLMYKRDESYCNCAAINEARRSAAVTDCSLWCRHSTPLDPLKTNMNLKVTFSQMVPDIQKIFSSLESSQSSPLVLQIWIMRKINRNYIRSFKSCCTLNALRGNNLFFSEIIQKHMNTFWEQNVEFMLDLMVHKLTTGPYRVNFFMALRPNGGHGLLILEVSRSHTTTHHNR